MGLAGPGVEEHRALEDEALAVVAVDEASEHPLDAIADEEVLKALTGGAASVEEPRAYGGRHVFHESISMYGRMTPATRHTFA